MVHSTLYRKMETVLHYLESLRLYVQNNLLRRGIRGQERKQEITRRKVYSGPLLLEDFIATATSYEFIGKHARHTRDEFTHETN